MAHIYETSNATSEVKTRPEGSSSALLLLQLRVNVAAASTTTWHASHLYSKGASPVRLEKGGEKDKIEIAHVYAASGDVPAGSMLPARHLYSAGASPLRLEKKGEKKVAVTDDVAEKKGVVTAGASPLRHLYSAGASPLCLESSGAPKKVEIEIAHVPSARASSEGDVFVRTPPSPPDMAPTPTGPRAGSRQSVDN